MKTLLTLLLLLVASPALATDRYVVSSGGVGTGTCPVGTPCALSYANSIAVAGDIVHLADGTYNTFPHAEIGIGGATRNGTISGGVPSYIEFRGNIANKDAVVINVTPNSSVNAMIDGDYVKYQYMKFPLGLAFCAKDSHGDNCDIIGSYINQLHVIGDFMMNNNKNCIVDSLVQDTTTGTSRLPNYFWLCSGGADGNPNPPWSSFYGCGGGDVTGNIIRNSTFNLNTGTAEYNSANGALPQIFFTDGSNADTDPLRLGIHNNLFQNNNFNVTFNSPTYCTYGTSTRACYMSYCTQDTFKYNNWNFTDNSAYVADSQRLLLRFKNRCNMNYFLGDHFTSKGTNVGWQLTAQSSGAALCDPTNQQWQGDNRWDACTFDWFSVNEPSTGYGSGMVFSWGLCRDTIQYCLFRSNMNGLALNNGANNPISHGCTYIHHNTFIMSDSSHSAISLPIGSFATDAALVIDDNIFYNTGPVVNASGGGAGLTINYPDNPNVTINNNLYYTKAYSSVVGDNDVKYKICLNDGTGCGALTYSTVGQGSLWYEASGKDANSIHQSPAFIDSTLDYQNLGLYTHAPPKSDGRLGPLTFALFNADGYVGAMAYRRLITLAPTPFRDSSLAYVNYYSPSSWPASGTLVQSGSHYWRGSSSLDSLADPHIMLSDSIRAIRVGANTAFTNSTGGVVTSIKALGWREGHPTSNRYTNSDAATITQFFTTINSNFHTADSLGNVWSDTTLKYITDYGPRVTSTWASQPAANSSLQLSYLPYLEIWGNGKLGPISTFGNAGPGENIAPNSIPPSPASITIDPCTRTYTVIATGNDSTTISQRDSLAYHNNSVQNANSRPTVEVIEYNPESSFKRSWFDGVVGAMQGGNDAVVIYRGIPGETPVDRTKTFTHSYALPIPTNVSYNLLRTRIIDGNGDWRYNNWAVSQPVIDRKGNVSEGAAVRVIATNTTSISGTINTNSQFSNFQYDNQLLLVVISYHSGGGQYSTATWNNSAFNYINASSNGNYTVEYFYVNNPAQGTISYAITPSVSSDVSAYFIPIKSGNPYSPISLTSTSGTTTDSMQVSVNMTCSSRILAVAVTSNQVTQTLTSESCVDNSFPGLSEGLIDLGGIGGGTNGYYEFTGLNASTTTTKTCIYHHLLPGAPTWHISAISLNK
jgi:hypothetical protein